jgi:hypothetical protein
VYELHPVHSRHHSKLRKLDKRSGHKSNYHIITKKSVAGFRLPDQVKFFPRKNKSVFALNDQG